MKGKDIPVGTQAPAGRSGRGAGGYLLKCSLDPLDFSDTKGLIN